MAQASKSESIASPTVRSTLQAPEVRTTDYPAINDPTSSNSLDPSVVEKLRRVVGEACVLTDPDELMVYESDGLTIHKCPPTAVVIPGSADEVAAAVKVLADASVP